MEEMFCGALIKHIHDEMQKIANNAMRADDLTMTQCGALVHLALAPGGELTLKELEKKLQVAQSTAAGIAVRLEQKRFVESMASADDKRVKRLHITAQGEARVRKAWKQTMAAEQRLLSPLDSNEREMLLQLLKKVNDNL